MTKFTDQEKADAAKREVKQRQRVYPRLCDQGKMTKQFADTQISIMQEIADEYEERAKRERLI